MIKLCGWSKAEAAKGLGVSERMIHSYVHGAACPSRTHFYRLLTAAGIDPKSDEADYYVTLHWAAVRKANEKRAISKRKKQ